MYFFLQWAEFIFFSCLMLVVCLIFSIMGYYYVPLKPEDVQGSANKQTPPNPRKYDQPGNQEDKALMVP